MNSRFATSAIAVAMATSALVGFGAAAEAGTLSGDRPLVIAHRGASGYLPEETLQAYQLAVQMGADVIEPDLFLSADGVLIARHDRSLNNTTNVLAVAAGNPALAAKAAPNGAYNIDALTLADIKSVTAKSRSSSGYQTVDTYYQPGFDYKVMTFNEVLDYVYGLYQDTGKIVGVEPEVKTISGNAAYNLAIADAMLLALADPKYGGFFDGHLDNVFLQSFDQSIVAYLNGKTSLPVTYLGVCPTTAEGAQAVAAIADGIGPSVSIISQACVDAAHAAGLTVHAYTLTDNPAQYEAVYKLGVDGIFGNHPDINKSVRDALFPVPEPAGLALFGLGLAGLGLMRRRAA